jgi:hypothetical protein
MPYRVVVRNVRYWRGNIKRWQSVYPFIGTPTSALATADAQAVLTAHTKMLWNGGVTSGNAYEAAIYDQATGGVPIVVYTAFDWLTPSTWTSPTNSVWGGSSVFVGQPAEQALIVEWNAGLSVSGKPVTLKKFYHHVKPSLASAGAPDVSSTDATALTTAANGLTVCLASKGLSLGSPSGRFAGSAKVKTYYGNHQMARGRRRKAPVPAASVTFDKILSIINQAEGAGVAQP